MIVAVEFFKAARACRQASACWLANRIGLGRDRARASNRHANLAQRLLGWSAGHARLVWLRDLAAQRQTLLPLALHQPVAGIHLAGDDARRDRSRYVECRLTPGSRPGARLAATGFELLRTGRSYLPMPGSD